MGLMFYFGLEFYSQEVAGVKLIFGNEFFFQNQTIALSVVAAGRRIVCHNGKPPSVVVVGHRW